MKLNIAPSAAIAAFALVTACGNDTSTGPGNSSVLSDADFSTLVQALGAVGAFGFKPATLTPSSVALALGTPQHVASTLSLNFDHSSPCPGGGSTRIVGTASVSAVEGRQTTTYVLNATATPSACSGSGASGQVFTFNGDPGITLSLTVTANQPGSYTFSGAETGAFGWTSNSGRSGSCSVNVTISGSSTATGVNSGTESGTICGRTTNTTY